MSDENNEKVKKALEKSFVDMMNTVNNRFMETTGHIEGLGKWMTSQLRILEKEMKSFVVNQKVLDFAVSTLVQLLEEKDILKEGEYRERAAKIYRDSNIDIVNLDIKKKQ